VYWTSWVLLLALVAVAAALVATHGGPWQPFVVGAGAVSLSSTLTGLMIGNKLAPPLGQVLLVALVATAGCVWALLVSTLLMALSILAMGCVWAAQLVAAAVRGLGGALPLADRFAEQTTCWLKGVWTV
jgi:hypothetical protein